MKPLKIFKYFILFLLLSQEYLSLKHKFDLQSEFLRTNKTAILRTNNTETISKTASSKSKGSLVLSKSKDKSKEKVNKSLNEISTNKTISNSNSKNKFLDPFTLFTIFVVLKAINIGLRAYLVKKEMNSLNELKNTAQDTINTLQTLNKDFINKKERVCNYMKQLLQYNKIMIVSQSINSYYEFLKGKNLKMKESDSSICIPGSNNSSDYSFDEIRKNFNVLRIILTAIKDRKTKAQIIQENPSIDFKIKLKKNYLCNDQAKNNIEFPNELVKLSSLLVEKNEVLTDKVCLSDKIAYENINKKIIYLNDIIKDSQNKIDTHEDSLLFNFFSKFRTNFKSHLWGLIKFTVSTGLEALDVEVDVLENLEGLKELHNWNVSEALEIMKNVQTYLDIINKSLTYIDNVIKIVESKFNDGYDVASLAISMLDVTQTCILTVFSQTDDSKIIGMKPDDLKEIAGFGLDISQQFVETFKEPNKFKVINIISSALNFAIKKALAAGLKLALGSIFTYAKIILDTFQRYLAFRKLMKHNKRKMKEIKMFIATMENNISDINKNNSFYKCQMLSNMQLMVNAYSDYYNLENIDSNNSLNLDEYRNVINAMDATNIQKWKIYLLEACGLYMELCINSSILINTFSSDEFSKAILKNYYGYFSDLIVVYNYLELESALRSGYEYIYGNFLPALNQEINIDYSKTMIEDIINNITDINKKNEIVQYLKNEIYVLLGCRGCSDSKYISDINILENIDTFYNNQQEDTQTSKFLLKWTGNYYLSYGVRSITNQDTEIEAFNRIKLITNDDVKFREESLDSVRFIKSKYNILNQKFLFKNLHDYVNHSDVMSNEGFRFAIKNDNIENNNMIDYFENLNSNSYHIQIGIVPFSSNTPKGYDYSITIEINGEDGILIKDKTSEKYYLNKHANIVQLNIGKKKNESIIQFLYSFFHSIYSKDNNFSWFITKYVHMSDKYFIAYHKLNYISQKLDSINQNVNDNDSIPYICGSNSECSFIELNEKKFSENEEIGIGLTDRFGIKIRKTVAFGDEKLNLKKCFDTYNILNKDISSENFRIINGEKRYDLLSNLSNGINIQPELVPITNTVQGSSLITSEYKINNRIAQINIKECNYVIYSYPVKFEIISNLNENDSYYTIKLDIIDQKDPTIKIVSDPFGPGIHPTIWIQYIIDYKHMETNDDTIIKYLEKKNLEAFKEEYSLFYHEGNSLFNLQRDTLPEIKYRIFVKYDRVLNLIKNNVCKNLDNQLAINSPNSSSQDLTINIPSENFSVISSSNTNEITNQVTQTPVKQLLKKK